MIDNTRLLQEMALQNAALMKAIGEITSARQIDEENRMKLAGQGEPVADSRNTDMAHSTPEKKRTSKKSSSVLLVERTPPKPPEGTPQKTKNKKVSESPASVSNRFAPLQNEECDEEDSFADAEEENEIPVLAPTPEVDETIAQDDHEADATITPTTQQLPGFGSNGVGQVE